MSGQSCTVAFAGNAVRVEYEGDRAGMIVGFVHPTARTRRHPPHNRTFRVQDDPHRGLTVRCDGKLCYAGGTAAEAARVLMDATGSSLAAEGRGGLVLHAAAVGLKRGALVLPGPTGAGKSTLTAWLAARGFPYLTDELVYVPHGSLAVQAFPRPMHIRGPAKAALESRVVAGNGLKWLTSELVALLQPIEPGRRLERRDLGAIVFPRYGKAGFHFARVSMARAGLLLMECLLNARNLEGHGFSAVTELVRRIPAYELTYSSFAELESWSQQLASEGLRAARARGRAKTRIRRLPTGGWHGRYAQRSSRNTSAHQA
jgi:hypothetical protein